MGGRRWNRWVQWILIIVVVGETTSLIMLDRLDGTKFPFPLRTLNIWPTSPFDSSATNAGGGKVRIDVLPGSGGEAGGIGTGDRRIGKSSCAAWLEEADRLAEGRNFTERPIKVAYGENENWDSCAVGCEFRSSGSGLEPDAMFRRGSARPPRSGGVSHVLRSMEPSSYYPENDVATAHASGFDVAMTTSLASDVPVGYFSWAEYEMMAPVQPKTEEALAVAFISNCAAHNFRLEALEELRNLKVSLDSYGKCHRNREAGDKLETLRHYKFSLAFENSNEADYVTEKFFQSLVAGSVPVVVGAPNIDEFAPAPNSFLHIKSQDDIGRVAQQMRYLASNATAYNQTLRWKYDGPSSAFKALVDMAAVHSSCRLCIHLATLVRMEEEKELAERAASKRPCQCTDETGAVVHHIYVRERGRFQLHSIFLDSAELTIHGLEAAILDKFRSLEHVPIWLAERPPEIRGDGSLNIYRLYPVGLTQRDALYSIYFHNDEDVKGHLEESPCPKLEVIFV